ncbi:uncharacterized protein L203_105907 [Cryptococcus depauperatus CBS 7841]|uniref:Uncharacterized protein n=1 Tax=Cryptococcus depauperatus CBS 7841 TaxID=1295531 RepID=A0A1E3HJP0_9TREE|nr:hypothetical protein L203_06421 [Cryptococcus depauperatus CBS 7841]
MSSNFNDSAQSCPIDQQIRDELNSATSWVESGKDELDEAIPKADTGLSMYADNRGALKSCQSAMTSLLTSLGGGQGNIDSIMSHFAESRKTVKEPFEEYGEHLNPHQSGTLEFVGSALDNAEPHLEKAELLLSGSMANGTG